MTGISAFGFTYPVYVSGESIGGVSDFSGVVDGVSFSFHWHCGQTADPGDALLDKLATFSISPLSVSVDVCAQP
jgi:hypothetical protein